MVADPPNAGAKEFLTEAVKHFRVNIYSSRTWQEYGLATMIQWCQDQFGLELTDQLYFPMQKPAAFLTIDDRCICFNGTWPSMREMLDFRPWSKKGV